MWRKNSYYFIFIAIQMKIIHSATTNWTDHSSGWRRTMTMNTLIPRMKLQTKLYLIFTNSTILLQIAEQWREDLGGTKEAPEVRKGKERPWRSSREHEAIRRTRENGRFICSAGSVWKETSICKLQSTINSIHSPKQYWFLIRRTMPNLSIIWSRIFCWYLYLSINSFHYNRKWIFHWVILITHSCQLHSLQSWDLLMIFCTLYLKKRKVRLFQILSY